MRDGGESLPDSGAPGLGDAPEGAWPAARGSHTRSLGYVLDEARGQLFARTEWQEDSEVHPRRAGPATPPGLTLIVTTRPHRKDVAGVPGQEILRHQPPRCGDQGVWRRGNYLATYRMISLSGLIG